jgi:hypothetical protein
MPSEKERVLRRFFLNKIFKKNNKDLDKNCEDIEEDFEPLDVDKFIESVENGELFDEKNNGNNRLVFANSKQPADETVSFDKTEELSNELINLYKFAEQNVMKFSRLEWFSFVTKSAETIKNFCCQLMNIPADVIELKYYCSKDMYKRAIENGEEHFSIETSIEDGSLALAQRECDSEGNSKFFLNINIETPMRLYVNGFPEIFATLFHEMWHLKEFYEEAQAYGEEQESQECFVEDVVKIIKDYQEQGLSVEEIKEEFERHGMMIDLKEINEEEEILLNGGESGDAEEDCQNKDDFRSRYERCIAYNNDIFTWSANDGERRADKFAYVMLRTLMKEAGAIRQMRTSYNFSGLFRKLHHTFSRIYVPVRAVYKALFNVNVPEVVYVNEETGEDFIAKKLRFESIERASELNKSLMKSNAYEMNEFFNQVGRTDLEGLEKIQDMFEKRNFRTVKKILEADDQIDGMERQMEDMQEDMEGETFTL